MLSFEELNSFKNQNDFIELLKNKLPKKRFDKIIEKATYNNRISQLQSDLVNLQNWVKKNNKRVCVIFEGRDAAGKGGAIKRFIEHLNPRYSRVVALSEPTQQEKGQWYFQRYLKKMPSSGEIIFFDRSWYNRAIVEPVMEFCDSQQYDLFMNQVNEFEKMLTEDGIILIKLWFSITKKEQKIRFIKRLSNPLKTWKFSKVDMEGQKRWKIYTDYKEKMFLKTDLTDSPWKIIDSNNKFSARISAIEYVLSKFKALPNNQKKLKNKKILKKEKLKDISKKDLKLLNKNKSLISLISRNDTSLPKTLRYYKYEKQLKKLQIEMIKLQNWVYKKNKKVIIICEGRDAAGKGGAIRRAIQNLNPRKLKVVALPKPDESENGQWYFQRYVEQFPNNGEIVFFDRSWYNRAVVEPVNGFCTKNEYDNFMSHVNGFENILINEGIILLKLYFSVSKQTQAKRFSDIQNSLLKKWKFTEVDGKAQELWDEYSHFKDKMFEKTNTKNSPWNIISADRKIQARIEAINLILKNVPYDSNTLIHSEKINF
jgi:polyphosphate kinase 2